MKIKSKIVSHLKLVHSFFVKGILIAGLAIASQNVMAHKKHGDFWHMPKCNVEHCCQFQGHPDEWDKSCESENGAISTCEHVTCPCGGNYYGCTN